MATERDFWQIRTSMESRLDQADWLAARARANTEGDMWGEGPGGYPKILSTKGYAQ